jgi:hypothetical protein
MIKRLARAFMLFAIVALAAANPAYGGLIGTTVTGSAELNFIPINVFDPANGFVPSGYLNDAGTTVTIAEPAIEFGAQTSTNLFTANFTDNELIITDVAAAPEGGTSFVMSFMDTAFQGLSVSVISDSFTGGVLPDLLGDELYVVWSGTVVSQPTTFQVVLELSPASVPEPSSFFLCAIGFIGAAGYSRRRRICCNPARARLSQSSGLLPWARKKNTSSWPSVT